MKLQLVAKYEKKLKGGPSGDFKKFPKKFLKKVIFEQCHSAEKCKRGTLWDFLTSIVLQNIERNEGGPFGAIQKISKKSRIVPKKVGLRWDP